MIDTYVICSLCQRRILSHAYRIQCCVCYGVYHSKCITLCPTEQQHLKDNARTWYCMCCNETVLPYNHIDDQSEFLAAVTNVDVRMLCISDKIFQPFELNDSEIDSQLYDIDPDVNYFNEINFHTTNRCKYYLEDTFCSEISLNENVDSGNSFSVIHLNIRIIKKNLDNFLLYLDSLNFPFTVVGLSETWLKDHDSQLYNLPGYSLIENHRIGQNGGGVGIFVKSNVEYYERSDLTYMTEHCETIFIELDKDSLCMQKNIIVGVIYRPPNSDAYTFIETMKNILTIVQRENKLCYLPGDYNINILNSETHAITADCVDLFYAHSFVPLVTRPTRITATSATLIDNIYTNNFLNLENSFQGVLITDISDHYPVFHINISLKEDIQEIIIIKRIFSDKNRQAFLASIA